MDSYTAQTWHGHALVSEITGLSIDAAREIASAAVITGHTGRLMQENADYCEVYSHNGVRRGTFAQTTLVLVDLAPEATR